MKKSVYGVVSLLALVACDPNGQSPFDGPTTFNADAATSASITNKAEAEPVSDAAKLRLGEPRDMIVQTMQDGAEVAGAKCELQNSLYEASVTTPSHVTLPNIAGPIDDLKITCKKGNLKGSQSNSSEVVPNVTINVAGEAAKVYTYQRASDTFTINLSAQQPNGATRRLGDIQY